MMYDVRRMGKNNNANLNANDMAYQIEYSLFDYSGLCLPVQALRD